MRQQKGHGIRASLVDQPVSHHLREGVEKKKEPTQKILLNTILQTTTEMGTGRA